MWGAFEVPRQDSLPNLGQCFGVEVSIDDFVRIDDDECGSDIGEDLVLAVSFDEIPKDLRLVKDVHLAHVSMEVALSHLKGVPEGSHHSETSLI
jgi:hypothetical protein